MSFATKKNAAIAVGVYGAIVLLAFALNATWMGLPAPFVAAFVFTRLNSPLEKEKSAIRGALLMSALAAVISIIAVSVMQIHVGADSEEVPGDFTVSIIATALVNACVGAAFGGIGGFVAEITRSAGSDNDTRPPARPSIDNGGDGSIERDLRDRLGQD